MVLSWSGDLILRGISHRGTPLMGIKRRPNSIVGTALHKQLIN